MLQFYGSLLSNSGLEIMDLKSMWICLHIIVVNDIILIFKELRMVLKFNKFGVTRKEIQTFLKSTEKLCVMPLII